MRVTGFVYPLKFRELCRKSARAYYQQYRKNTPPEILNAYLREEYDFQEWLQNQSHGSREFRFLYAGNLIAGFMRIRCKSNHTEILKIFIFPQWRKQKGAQRLMGTLCDTEVRLRVYAGNVSAIRIFHRAGFRKLSTCTFAGKHFVQSGLILYQYFKSV